MSNIFSQKQYVCLDWKSDASVNTFLIQKMHRQYDERRKEFNRAITSQKLTQEYMLNVRKKFANILGNFPAKTSLHAITTGTLHREGYQVEKIIYESFPEHHVTANLYIPNGKRKFPAVLLFCGHENESKATASYQKTAILFVKNGFIVLMIIETSTPADELWDNIRGFNSLVTRPEVDTAKIGCLGNSGGGMQNQYSYVINNVFQYYDCLIL